MKIPVTPPNFDDLYRDIVARLEPIEFVKLIENMSPIDTKGRYLHWDKLRYLPAPHSLDHATWWFQTKFARRGMYQPVPLHSIAGTAFKYAKPNPIEKKLHHLDLHAAGSIHASEVITREQTRDTYLIRSLIEEAINSSQLEGASTTQDVAKEMIRQDRAPEDESERMIMNNYHAMQFIREIKDEDLSPEIIFGLHKILTADILPEEKQGKFRGPEDKIHIIDERTQEYLHTPPAAEQLAQRMEALCQFANQKNSDDDASVFIHPVVKAIVLHFMLAYDHPFVDGNGRTARALFYWSMARQGYWLMEFISISRVIKQAPAPYAQAFLYTETDENDLTYFLVHQLDVIQKAIDALHVFLAGKVQGIQEAEKMLDHNPKLRGQLNFRQLALLRHALKHPRFSYVITEHQRSHGISYDVARKDLLQMADKLNLLIKTKRGKSYYFVVPADLEKRIVGKK